MLVWSTKVNYMTLNGSFDLGVFLNEWWNSEENDATYLQSEGGIWLMPYGNSLDITGSINERFSGSSRRHTFIERDFKLTGNIDGGGYLFLSKDRASCSHGRHSTDFPSTYIRETDEFIPNKEEVVNAVTLALLFGN